MSAREYGLGLGSNLGDRLGNLRAARRRIASLSGVEILAASPVYETEPVGVRDLHRSRSFLNAVLIAAYAGEPRGLARALHRVEGALGRVRTADRNAPRVIDIDVIYADGEHLRGPELILPHERWFERRFVVQPLCDVRPDLVIPGQTGTVREVLLSLSESPEVVLFEREWR